MEIFVIIAKLVADYVSEGLANLLPKIAAGFERFFTVVLWKFLTKLIAVFEVSWHELYEYLVGLTARTVGRTILGQSPQEIEATERLSHQIGSEITTSLNVIAIAFWSCVAVTTLFLILPMLYKAVFRRNLRIFISFNRLRGDVAGQLQSFLENCKFHVSRVPFVESAEHQVTLQKIIELLKQSELVVCIPGPSISFVENEVLAATAIGHPVILLVSEKDGSIPDTADKRYPVFQLESLVDQGFHPIEAFLSFIGGDLKSMRNICWQALRQGLIRNLSKAIGLAISVAIVGLWILCFAAVENTAAASLATLTNPWEAYAAIGSHFVVLAAWASATALCLIYCFRVVQSQIRQLLAQRRAQLKVKAAEFRRDDWVDLIAELSFGNVIYEAMFETAPLAHHEKLLPVKTA
jgi:hypothetical protein